MTRNEIANRLLVIIGDLNELLFNMESDGRRREDIHPSEYNAVVSCVERLNDINYMLNDE